MSKRCEKCGEHRWAAKGFCLSLTCAGHYLDPDFPKSAPEEDKWYRQPVKASSRKSAPKARKPRKGAKRSDELYYREILGTTPPWEQKDDLPS